MHTFTNIKASHVVQNLKSRIIACTVIFSLLVCSSFYTSLLFAELLPSKVIGISQIVEHPALDTVREGILDSLKAQGFEQGKNLTVLYENAQGSVITATQIASKLLQSHLDLVVGISTPSAQTLFYEALKLKDKIPIVFSAVSDPKAAKLEIDPEYPITGITDRAHLVGLLELMQNMMPHLRTLGLMYNPAEANSVSTIWHLKELLKAKGIRFVEVTVNKTQDVAQATKSLLGKVEALYLPQDNTVVSAIQAVINATTQSASPLPVVLPIFTSDPLLIKNGVLAAVGYDYWDVGKETGVVVGQILKGEKAQQIAIHNPKELKAVINVALAEKLGFPIPQKLEYATVQLVK
jgi:putative ABC transport system substrate-binding protein